MKKPFEEPQVEVVPRGDVHMAKSWNPGKGKDKTGTGNSDHGGGNGRGGNNNGGNGRGGRGWH